MIDLISDEVKFGGLFEVVEPIRSSLESSVSMHVLSTLLIKPTMQAVAQSSAGLERLRSQGCVLQQQQPSNESRIRHNLRNTSGAH